MDRNAGMEASRRGLRTWQAWMWLGAAALLCVPALAMRLGDEVNWTAIDFVVMGAMLAILCGCIHVGSLLSRHWAYRAGTAVAAGAGFLQTWANLAVGIVGDGSHPVNLAFFGVIGLAGFGAVLALFKPRGMAAAMLAAAIAQAAVLAYSVVSGLDPAVWLTGVFVLMWLVAWRLFLKSAGDGEGGPG